jgi:hypothetical protein
LYPGVCSTICIRARRHSLDPTAPIPADSSVDAKDFTVMKSANDHWA